MQTGSSPKPDGSPRGAIGTSGGSGLDGARVFVVEDHPFQRAALVALLRAVGVQHVEEAGNGREAIAQLERQALPPHVILCDLEMPEMDGIQCLRVVAERRLARGVVIVSGREAEILWSVEAMARASGLAVFGQMTKPATRDALLGVLARVPLDGVTAKQADAEPAVDAAALRQALAGREFHAVFQPKVSLVTGAVLGVEALARWRRPDGRFVGPNVFVPEMVRADLITALTERVLDSACEALRAWREQGLVYDLAINLSMATLSRLDTADRFLEQVRDYGLDPRRVTFEVTETELMADFATVVNVLARLRLKGFRLSIDDFGTGYSSLAQLNAIPFTELKIDQTFVRNCDRTPRLYNIVESSIGLARRLGIRTVGEGIETEREWSLLRTALCDEGQGYFIARPMPAGEIPGWSARWVPPPRP